MKANYFGYSLYDPENHQYIPCDMREFLDSFCAHSDNAFKNTFTRGTENLYLLREGRGKYVFLKTSSDDIIKRIESDTMTMHDIRDGFDEEDELAFASYIVMTENHFSLACSLHAPRMRTFSDFMNQLLQNTGLRGKIFVVNAFISVATRAEAMSFTHIGRSTIEMDRESGIFSEIAGTFGFNTNDSADIGSIEVTFKPKRRTNIQEPMRKLINQIPMDGIEKFMVSAKAAAGDLLTDVYLSGSSAVQDFIDPKSRFGIHQQMKSCMARNPKLLEKVKEYEETHGTTEDTPSDLLDIASNPSWPDTPMHVQDDD